MHMHNGVGRTGYLLITLSFFLMGGLGLAVSVLAFESATTLFFQVGVALAAFGLLTLFAFALAAPWLDRPAPRRLPVPEKPAKKTRPRAAADAPAVRTRGGKPWTGPVDEALEFDDVSPASGPSQAPSGPTFEFDDARPARKAAPTTLEMPQAFRDDADDGHDPAQWPQERGKRSDWSAQRQREADVRQQVEDSPVRREMADRYTQNTPTVRSMLQTEDVPTRIAERAPEGVGAGFAAPGMSVGRCGQCSTALLAPDARPLRLKCPECAKVTLLQ